MPISFEGSRHGDAHPWAEIVALACTVIAGIGFALFQTPDNRVLFLPALVERSGAAGGAGHRPADRTDLWRVLCGRALRGAGRALVEGVVLILAAVFAVVAGLEGLARLRFGPVG